MKSVILLPEKEKEATMPENVSSSEINSLERKELGFKLPLSISVEGRDASGQSFREKTILSYISHQGSSFWLTHPVFLGDALKLTISLPQKLAEEENLKLIIKGKVVFLEANNAQNSEHRISLKFENRYIIKAEK